MKIGELAKLANVSTKMLRHYDAIGLFSPEAIDVENGYRIYSPEQLHKLKWITTLRMLDFSLDDIRNLLSGPVDSGAFLTALAQKRILLDQQFKQTLIKSLQVDYLLNLIKLEGFHMEKNIDISKLNETNLLNIKKGLPNMDMLLEKAYQMMAASLSGNTFGLFRLDLKQFKAINDVDGFEVGDKVILSLYKTLEDTLSKYDLNASIARAGGDEFVVFAEGQKQVLSEMAAAFKSEVLKIDYQAIGCHKPVEVYLGGILSNSMDNQQIRSLLDETHDLLFEAKKDLSSGGPGICVIEKLD